MFWQEESKITRFDIEYAYGDKRYAFGEILVPVTEEEKKRDFEDIATNGLNEENCVKMICSDSFDRTGKTDTQDVRRASITEDYYDIIKEMVNDNDLIYFQNGETIPYNFDYENTPEFFEFYIEYESGKIMSGFSDDPVKCEKFKDIAAQFSDFFDSYFEENAKDEY